jgi:hypothetical protein
MEDAANAAAAQVEELTRERDELAAALAKAQEEQPPMSGDARFEAIGDRASTQLADGQG